MGEWKWATGKEEVIPRVIYRFSARNPRITFPPLMNRITLSLFAALGLIGAACERHPASELAGEGGEHHAAAAEKAAPEAPKAEAPKTEPAAKPAEAAKPESAPKFIPDSAK
jgi:hypothetical protein